MDDGTDWITPSEAGRLLERCAMTVIRMADRGQVRCVRTSLGRLLDRRDVLRLAAERSAQTAAH